MTLELLISAVKKDPESLLERMNIRDDAVLINQCDRYDYRLIERHGKRIRAYDMAERGVGLSRNNALLRAEADIVLFSDDDIIYEDNAGELVLKEFEKHPEADMLLFNVEVTEDRRTYHNAAYKRVHLYNCGRYPSYSFALKREKMHAANLTFSLLFGGGARYSNGEDSLFIRDCIVAGLKVYTVPAAIGKEVSEGSTWFSGYHRKFFFDRGVLYHFLYGRLAKPLSARFLLKHRGIMCNEISVKAAYRIMCEGIESVK